MFQSRTHTCNELRMEHVGQNVTIVGWYENLRKVSKNLGFLVLRDFYGTTQVVIEVLSENVPARTRIRQPAISKSFRLPLKSLENAVTMSFHLKLTVPRKLMKMHV